MRACLDAGDDAGAADALGCSQLELEAELSEPARAEGSRGEGSPGGPDWAFDVLHSLARQIRHHEHASAPSHGTAGGPRRREGRRLAREDGAHDIVK